MDFLCEKKFIMIPADFGAPMKRLCFYVGTTLVYDLVAGYEPVSPTIRFPIDLSRFAGEKIRAELDDGSEVLLEQTDFPETDYSGSFRPHIHFTARRGWINDPNGLVFYKGRYLMFFQHNPASTVWGNMHWGLAESRDLMHWQEKGDVVFPDENGTIFSGSGIVDRLNASGLKEGEDDPLLFFYTSAGDTSATSAGKLFTQRLVYSTDGGRSFHKYPSAVLEHIAGENRDPKVIYYEPDHCYIMALYLDGHEYALFRSENLLDWRELQRMELPGDAECPDFYPLCADGDSANVKWILSGASDRYLIGTFDGCKFRPETTELRLNYGNASYAAQSWSDLPDGRRVRTAFVNHVIPGQPFGCCMDIPQEMSLRTVAGSLRLCAEPVEELGNAYTRRRDYGNCSIGADKVFTCETESLGCKLEVEFSSACDITISLFGLEIKYLPHCGELVALEQRAPVAGEDGRVSVSVIYDRFTAEIFADRGSVFMGMTYEQDEAEMVLRIESGDLSDCAIHISETECIYR